MTDSVAELNQVKIDLWPLAVELQVAKAVRWDMGIGDDGLASPWTRSPEPDRPKGAEVIGLREMIVLDMRIHRGSFLLGLGIGAAAAAVVVASVNARQRRAREREGSPM